MMSPPLPSGSTDWPARPVPRTQRSRDVRRLARRLGRVSADHIRRVKFYAQNGKESKRREESVPNADCRDISPPQLLTLSKRRTEADRHRVGPEGFERKRKYCACN